jgi:hypothetical protein
LKEVILYNVQEYIAYAIQTLGETQEGSWLRHYATSRKAAGSIPVEIIGLFN